MSATDRTREAEEAAATDARARTDDDDPAAVRWQIELTRQALGDTVQALADKADVKTHMRERVDRRRESLRTTATSSQGTARAAAIGIGAAVAVLLVMRMRRRR